MTITLLFLVVFPVINVFADVLIGDDGSSQQLTWHDKTESFLTGETAAAHRMTAVSRTALSTARGGTSSSSSSSKSVVRSTPLHANQQTTAQERLYQRIISNEQLTRPDLTDVPINVTVRVILIKLQDLVEKSELMETTVRIQIGWRDKRLAWDKNDYGQLPEILLPSSSVWIPDLAVINSVSDVYSVVRDSRFEIKVESDGQLWWHPTGVLRTFCKLQLSYFPFDRQKCSIIVESPTFDRRFLKLKLRSERTPVDLRMYVESETWRLEKTFGTSQDLKVGVNTYFSRIEFWLVIERARLYHSINFILPCFILSAIQTVFFFLPATHPQRVGSTTVTMLSVMVFQSMVVAQLPKTSESVPLLSIYIDLIILVSATSVGASIFTALCNFYNDRRVKVPAWLRHCCGWHRSLHRRARRQQPPPPLPPHQHPSGAGEKRGSKPTTSAHESEAFLQQPAHSAHPRQELSPGHTTNFAKLAAQRDDQLRRRCNTQGEQTGYLAIQIPPLLPTATGGDNPAVPPVVTSPRPKLQRRLNPTTSAPIACSSESEDMTVFSAVVIENDKDGNPIEPDETTVSWLDVLQCINFVLGCICAMAISLGPAIIFGVIPSVVDHQDYPAPIGENFSLLTNAQVRRL